MADRYQQLINTPIGRIVSKQVGLPSPVKLERYEPGQPVDRRAGAARRARPARGSADRAAAIGAEVARPEVGAPDAGRTPASNSSESETFKALVFDATGIASSDELPRGVGVLSPDDPPGARRAAG